MKLSTQSAPLASDLSSTRHSQPKPPAWKLWFGLGACILPLAMLTYNQFDDLHSMGAHPAAATTSRDAQSATQPVSPAVNSANSASTRPSTQVVQPRVPFVMPTTVRHLSPSARASHANGKLTVVAVNSGEMQFHKGKFKHGFGYDLARNFANQQDMNLKFVTVRDNATALRWVADGKAQLALTTAKPEQVNALQLSSLDLTCDGQSILQQHGFNTRLSWVASSPDLPLSQSVTAYSCDLRQTGQLQALASFYDRQYLNGSMKTVVADIKDRLPQYKASFKESAKLFDLDWQFLAAVGYQESYLNPESVSPTGVRGLMMLTEATAQSMGIQDRVDPQQSIYGGARFLHMMLEQYRSVPYPDRYWMALVGYNMGPGALDQVRQQIRQQGGDANSWMAVHQYLSDHQASNSRYTQTLQYAKRIRVYLEQFKTNRELMHL